MLMLCPICAGEFDTGANECPSCGCGMVSSSIAKPADDRRRHTESVRLVELCRPRLFPVAMLIKQTLEQNGVVAIVQGAHSMSLLPHLAFSGELRVLVDSREEEFARELYKAYFECEEADYSNDE